MARVEAGVKTADLEDLLPESRDEIDELLEESRVSLKAYENLLAEEDEDNMRGIEPDGASDNPDDLIWVNLNFRVSLSQAKVIEAEITRISETLKGKHVRARALEYMAAQSGTTPISDI